MVYDWDNFTDLTSNELSFVMDSIIYCYVVHRAYAEHRPDRYKIMTNSDYLYSAAQGYGITNKSVRELLVRLVPTIIEEECPE